VVVMSVVMVVRAAILVPGTGARARAAVRAVLAMPHNTLVLRRSIHAMRFDVFRHVGKPAAEYHGTGSRRG